MSALAGSVAIHGAALGVCAALVGWSSGTVPAEPPTVEVRAPERSEVETSVPQPLPVQSPAERPPRLRSVPVPPAEPVAEEPGPPLRPEPPPFRNLRGSDPATPPPVEEAGEAEDAPEPPDRAAPTVVSAVPRPEPPTQVVPPRVDPSASEPVPYPVRARRHGWEGVCRVLVRIAADGRVIAAEVRESSGHKVLDRAAVRGVRSWRFHPRSEDGRAVEGSLLVPVRFRIRP